LEEHRKNKTDKTNTKKMNKQNKILKRKKKILSSLQVVENRRNISSLSTAFFVRTICSKTRPQFKEKTHTAENEFK
jgi:hypothetical protein